MTSQAVKGAKFAAMHRSSCFVMANAWDAGSARLLESIGFHALGTTSAGMAFSLGMPDFVPSRSEFLRNAREIAGSTSLPVSGDLIHGFGETPKVVAETILAAAKTGLVGCSIEDAIPDANAILPIDLATARISTAVQAARSLPFEFTITARADNYFRGIADLNDTIARLRSYEAAGADVLYAPCVTDPAELATLIKSVSRPVNVLSGIGGNSLTVSNLRDLGARRISWGSTLWSVANKAACDAAKSILITGGFEALSDQLPYSDVMRLFSS